MRHARVGRQRRSGLRTWWWKVGIKTNGQDVQSHRGTGWEKTETVRGKKMYWRIFLFCPYQCLFSKNVARLSVHRWCDFLMDGHLCDLKIASKMTMSEECFHITCWKKWSTLADMNGTYAAAKYAERVLALSCPSASETDSIRLAAYVLPKPACAFEP